MIKETIPVLVLPLDHRQEKVQLDKIFLRYPREY